MAIAMTASLNASVRVVSLIGRLCVYAPAEVPTMHGGSRADVLARR